MATVPVLLQYLGQYDTGPFSPPLAENGTSAAHTWTPSNPHCLEYEDVIVWRQAPFVTDTNFAGAGNIIGNYGPFFDTVPATKVVPDRPPFEVSTYMASLRSSGRFYKPWEVEVPTETNAFGGAVTFPHAQDGKTYRYRVLMLTNRRLDSADHHHEPEVDLNVTVDGDTVTFSIGFLSFEHYWDSVKFHDGLTKAQLRIGETTHNITLSAELLETQNSTVLGEDAAAPIFSGGTWNYQPVTHQLSVKQYRMTGSIEFPFTDEQLSVRLGNNYGEWLLWQDLKYLPEVAGTLSVTDNIATYDFSATRVLGGTIGQTTGYYRVQVWRAATGEYTESFLTEVTSGEPIVTIDLNDLEEPNIPTKPPLSDGDLLRFEAVIVTDAGCSGLLEDTARIGGQSRISIAYDERRLSWWLLRGVDGNLTVERYLGHQAPSGNGIVVGGGRPGTLRRYGAWLYVISHAGVLFTSHDEGETWEHQMAIANGLTLIDFIVDSKGGVTRSLMLDSSNEPWLVVARRTNSGWIADEPEAVEGLPDGMRRPGALAVDGATVILAAQDGNDVFQATSADSMKSWTVSP